MPYTRDTDTGGHRRRAWLRWIGVSTAIAAALLLVFGDRTTALRAAVVCALAAGLLIGLSTRGAPADPEDVREDFESSLRREVDLVRDQLQTVRRGMESTLRREVDLVRAELDATRRDVSLRWEASPVFAEPTRRALGVAESTSMPAGAVSTQDPPGLAVSGTAAWGATVPAGSQSWEHPSWDESSWARATFEPGSLAASSWDQSAGDQPVSWDPSASAAQSASTAQSGSAAQSGPLGQPDRWDQPSSMSGSSSWDRPPAETPSWEPPAWEIPSSAILPLPPIPELHGFTYDYPSLEGLPQVGPGPAFEPGPPGDDPSADQPIVLDLRDGTEIYGPYRNGAGSTD